VPPPFAHHPLGSIRGAESFIGSSSESRDRASTSVKSDSRIIAIHVVQAAAGLSVVSVDDDVLRYEYGKKPVNGLVAVFGAGTA
jgi:hypothetical protein